MKVVIRTDASTNIGGGHVMRCLALAKELKRSGALITFISRRHNGNLNQLISKKGFNVVELQKPNSKKNEKSKNSQNSHTDYDWLGIAEIKDAEDTIKIVGCNKPDWLIVDHYSLGEKWENRLRSHVKKIMVIDDLANRKHDCDMLLDQTYQRADEEYTTYVDKSCVLLVGTKYALIRHQFKILRERAINRRSKYSTIKNVLVTMGSTDPHDLTSLVIDALSKINWVLKPEITLVLTSNFPHIQNVNKKALLSKLDISIKKNVSNMAELMLEADIAIGCSGSTSWERCCMGLPTVIVIDSSNQKAIGMSLVESGAAFLVSNTSQIVEGISNAVDKLKDNHKYYNVMFKTAIKLADGQGVKRVVGRIINQEAIVDGKLARILG